MSRKYKVTFVCLLFSLFIAIILIFSMVFVEVYNEIKYYERHKPYSQVFSRNYTEYKIINVSTTQFVGELTRMIENDSSACYGNQRCSYISSAYKQEAEKVYKIQSYNLGENHYGPKRYDITFLIPYNTNSIHLSGEI